VAAWREAASPEIQDEYFSARGFKQGISDEEKEEICARICESLTHEEQTELDTQRRRPLR